MLAEHIDSQRRLTLMRDAENWLKSRPRDHMLLLALGRLALAEQLWGKAQSYLEASVSMQPTLCAHAELSKLFATLGKDDKAAQHQALALKIAPATRLLAMKTLLVCHHTGAGRCGQRLRRQPGGAGHAGGQPARSWC